MKAGIWLALGLVIVLLGACTDPAFKLRDEGQSLLNDPRLSSEEKENLNKWLGEFGRAYNNANPDETQKQFAKAGLEVAINRIKERLAAKRSVPPSTSQPSMPTRQYVAAYLVKFQNNPSVGENPLTHYEPSYRILEASELKRMEDLYPKGFVPAEGYHFSRAAGPFTTHQQIVEYVQSNGLKNVNW